MVLSNNSKWWNQSTKRKKQLQTKGKTRAMQRSIKLKGYQVYSDDTGGEIDSENEELD